MATRSKRDRAYRRWYDMIKRCVNPSDNAWPNYGGRGITVCPEWRASFQAYYDHMGDAPPGMWLERIDNNGNYEPGNVRWATPKEQRANQRYDHNLIKTHCPRNHPYDEANTYLAPSGRRHCRSCTRDRDRLAKRRLRAKAKGAAHV